MKHKMLFMCDIIALVCSISNALKYPQDVDDIQEQAQQPLHPGQLDEDRFRPHCIIPPRRTSPPPRLLPSPVLQVLFYVWPVAANMRTHIVANSKSYDLFLISDVLTVSFSTDKRV